MPGISVPFSEHEDSPIERGNRDGDMQFTRIFLTAWADRWAFLQGLFTGGFVGLPMSYSSDWPTIFADTFDISRIVNDPINESITNPATQLLRHNGIAKITVNYKAMSDQGLYTYEQQETGEFVTVPSRGLKWQSDGDALAADINPAYPTSTTAHVIEMLQVRAVPWVTLRAMINKVNSVAFRVPVSGEIFEAGTLLFTSRRASISLNFSGLTTWKVGLTFLEKTQKQWHASGTYGWNYQWREDTGSFDKPLNATTGEQTFQEADLMSIFTATV